MALFNVQTSGISRSEIEQHPEDFVDPDDTYSRFSNSRAEEIADGNARHASSRDKFTGLTFNYANGARNKQVLD